MDELEKTLADARAEKQELISILVKDCKVAHTDRPDLKALEVHGIRFLIENGKVVGWYVHGTPED